MLSQVNLFLGAHPQGHTSAGITDGPSNSAHGQVPYNLSGSRVWHGQEYRGQEEKYVIQISPTDILELESAVLHFKGGF